MRFVPVIILLAACVVVSHQPAAPSQPADLIVHNAVVYTMADGQPTAEAFAVRGGRFVAVGTSADVLRWRGPATRVVDNAGLTVVPGLQDAHGHVLGLGKPLQELDLRGTPQLRRDRREGAREGRHGEAWRVDPGPRLGPEPVAGSRLARAGPARCRGAREPGVPDAHRRPRGAGEPPGARPRRGSRGTPAIPPGGRLIRDASGMPTGVLVDVAQSLVAGGIPRPSREQLDRAAVACRPRDAACRPHDGPRCGRVTRSRRSVPRAGVERSVRAPAST